MTDNAGFLFTGIPSFDKSTWDKMIGEKEMSDRIFDKFVDALEEVIDCQDDMWGEEQYENHIARRKIHDERFVPAKDKLRKALDDYIDNRVLEGLKKHGVSRKYFT